MNTRRRIKKVVRSGRPILKLVLPPAARKEAERLKAGRELNKIRCDLMHWIELNGDKYNFIGEFTHLSIANESLYAFLFLTMKEDFNPSETRSTTITYKYKEQ